jgi:tetratricopeptide (TPR) repeat protein
MGEFRFATVVVAAAIATAADSVAALARSFGPKPRYVLLALGGIAALSAVPNQVKRVIAFAGNPPTPFGDVGRNTVSRFDAYARILGLKSASLMVPDVGAPLLTSSLTIYDLAGLTEPDILFALKADTVYWRWEHPEFYELVFERLKPTFISTGGFWTMVAGLENDPRFVRDYVAIHSFDDRYVKDSSGKTERSGDFVRRDVAGQDGVARLRKEYQPPAQPDAFVWRVIDSLHPLDSEEALRKAATDATVLDPEARPGCTAPGCRPNVKRAASVLARLVQRAPGELNAWLLLGQALEDGGRAFEARPVWEKVRQLAQATHNAAAQAEAASRLEDPADRMLMTTGLAALYESANYPRAIALFRQLLAMVPRHYGATYQLARALTRARLDARQAWRDVLALAEASQDQNLIMDAKKHLGE